MILFSVPVAVIMVGLKPSDVPPPLGVKVLSAGTAACIADLVTFPLDTAKVRLQVRTRTQSPELYIISVLFEQDPVTFAKTCHALEPWFDI